MSVEGLRPKDNDKKEVSQIPQKEAFNDIFSTKDKPIIYPSLTEIKSLFPAEKLWVTEDVRIGRVLKSYVRNKDFAKKAFWGEMTSFYEGAYAAVYLLRKNTDENSRLQITRNVELDSVHNMKIRRQYWELKPQDELLKQNEQLFENDEKENPLNMKVLALAFDRSHPQAFVGGATVIMDLYKTAHDLEKLRTTPRQEASKIFPLQIEDAGISMKKFYDDSKFVGEIKNMQRENPKLYSYVKEKHDKILDTSLPRSKGFMQGAFCVYHLFRNNALAQGLVTPFINDEFIKLEKHERLLDKKPWMKSVLDDGLEEIYLMSKKDKQYVKLLRSMSQYNKNVQPEMFLGVLEGVGLMMRVFRSIEESDKFEKMGVDVTNTLLIEQRENKAREKRMEAETEVKTLVQWYNLE